MGDMYTELLVKKEKTGKDTGLRILTIGGSVIFFILGLFFNILFLLPAIVLGACSYFVYQRTDLEFEYLYVNGELDIDKIMSKIKRKKEFSVDIKNAELVAPVNSDRLSPYKSAQTKDYSSGNPSHKRYAIICHSDGKMTKTIFEPDEELIQKIKYSAPSKVFLD